MGKAAPKNLRICLAWRDGRPRWEPSPASRKAGLKGVDLRRADRTWMDRGEAIAVADARTLWADAIRSAMGDGADGEQGRLELRQALEGLEPAADAAAGHRRALMADLFETGWRLLGEADRAPRSAPPGRTVGKMIDAYLEADDVQISAGTRKIYKAQSRRLRERLGERLAGEVNRGQLVKWYADLRTVERLSLSNANQCLATAQAIFAWGARQDPPWAVNSPATKLKLQAASGRRVIWTAADETAFVAWADDNGWEDIADAVVALLWTGASPIDCCAVNLSQLDGLVWRFVRHKTRRHGQEAMPAIMAPLRQRLDRRKAQLVAAIDGAFLFDPRIGRRYTTNSLGRRFREARARFVASKKAPDGFIHKRLQDCRDTCITRLWEAGVKPHRMYAWTGHSADSIAEILREHYVFLREQGSLEMAGQLAEWAQKEGMAI